MKKQIFTVPTEAYYKVLLPDGSEHTLRMEIGKSYEIQELQKLATSKIEADKELLMRIITSHFEGEAYLDSAYNAIDELLAWRDKAVVEARIDEHRILDELAEKTANVDVDKAIDDYAEAKKDRLTQLNGAKDE